MPGTSNNMYSQTYLETGVEFYFKNLFCDTKSSKLGESIDSFSVTHTQRIGAE